MSADHQYAPHTEAWKSLGADVQRLSGISIEALFATDPNRFRGASLDVLGILLDFSRQRIDAEVLDHLLELAQQTGVAEAISRMFSGAHINNTEDRPALHVALRRLSGMPMVINGQNLMVAVEREREKMRDLVRKLERGEFLGYTGRRITDVVNIGIGGSDLGIAMAVEALAEYRLQGIGVHFISNIDGVDLEHVLQRVDPATTLFVICSKSFSTLETLTNASAVREWLLARGGTAAVAAQCIAISTNARAMDEFGIAEHHRLAMWDWVGGRFSLWSAVGLTIALAVGWKNFDAMLTGAYQMDEHFRTAEIPENLPVLLALIGIWNRNFLGAGTLAVLPYDDHLARLPAFLQQLEMESNGKSVRRGGQPVECATCPVIWGEPGSNAQHSFYQLLHQGTGLVAVDFLLGCRSGVGRDAQQQLAIDNCLAQSWALAAGDPDAAGPVAGDSLHQHYRGSRPNTLILFDRLNPVMLGKLIALYEHKVYVQGHIWDINSFDQFGVELGKRLASRLSGIKESAFPEPIRGALTWLADRP